MCRSCHLFAASKPSHAHYYTRKETKLFQQLVTQFAQVSPRGQGNNSYRQVNDCAETTPVLIPVHQDISEPVESFIHCQMLQPPSTVWVSSSVLLGSSVGMTADDPLTGNNFTLTPLGLMLLDYGCNSHL